MDDAPHGVIYFSFGSILRTSEKVHLYGESFISVFRQIPQRVLMKWEADQPYHNLPKNDMTSKWFPQPDILGNIKLYLFVTIAVMHLIIAGVSLNY